MEREKYGIDPERYPAHKKEKIGKVVYNKGLARDNGEALCVSWAI